MPQFRCHTLIALSLAAAIAGCGTSAESTSTPQSSEAPAPVALATHHTAAHHPSKALKQTQAALPLRQRTGDLNRVGAPGTTAAGGRFVPCLRPGTIRDARPALHPRGPEPGGHPGDDRPDDLRTRLHQDNS